MRAALLLLLLCALPLRAITLNVAATEAAITNAFTTMQNGDRVEIGAGTAEFSTPVLIDRNISFTIVGAGTNVTILKSVGSLSSLLRIYSSGAGLVTISNLSLDLSGTSGSGYGFQIGGPSFTARYLISHIHMPAVVGRAMAVGYSGTHGLIHHVVGIAAVGFAEMVDFNGNFETSWASAIPFGTENASYVEDCYFKTTPTEGAGNGFFDAYDGAQFVVRRCVFDGSANTGGHGYDSGTCSPRSFEIYNNRWTNQTVALPAVSLRGATGVAFSNDVSGDATATVLMTYYRSCPQDHDYGGTDTNSLATGEYYRWLPLGQPGQPYYIYFTGHTNDGNGLYKYFNGQPTEGQALFVGFTKYTFTTNLGTLAFGTGDFAGRGGGGVKIGANLAQTITNLYKAVNLVPDGAGVAYSNTFGVAYNIGHDFIATGLTTTRLELINALDSYTNGFGYPAYHQAGTITAEFPITGTNFHQNFTMWPCYSWSNTLNGVGSQFSVPNDSCNNLTNLVKENRDWFKDVIPAANVYTPIGTHSLAAAALDPGPYVPGTRTISLRMR